MPTETTSPNINVNEVANANVILFGADPTEGIVAVEVSDFGAVRYRRTGDVVKRETVPFKAWMLLTERPATPLVGAELTELEGEGFRWLARFPTLAAGRAARFRVRDDHLEHISYVSGAKMALSFNGQTLFIGMSFDDVVRLQFDIETDGLSPLPETNRVLLIAVSDNRGHLELIEGDEREILERFAACVRQRNPDVIEGHNLLNFDLPFVIERANRWGVPLIIGRDGSEPRIGRERNYAIGGNSRPFAPVHIHGRHVIDTYLTVQRFDWAKGALSSYGLKECARAFGFAEQDRVELPRAEIARIYRDDPELVREYARQDVVETRKLADLVTPVEFYQTQMIPDNYAQVAVTGAGEKINSLFVRAYLAAGRAIPRQQQSRPYAGGYTEVRRIGLITHVVKADVESLYPSLMLAGRIAPATDSLGVFLPALEALTKRRFDAKRRAAEARSNVDTEAGRREFVYWDGMQGSFKVLINSFYGYLGAPFNWNDYAAAERVTEEGRTLVQDVARRMEETGAAVIEIDTDGVYFTPPPNVNNEPEERAYVERIGAALPDGVRLAFDGRFARMLSLKTKNYVLLRHDDRMIFTGASLRSRADERYGRRFLEESIRLLFHGEMEAVAALYADLIDRLMSGRIPIEELTRRERVTENTFSSDLRKRMADVAKGATLGDHIRVYERNDGALARVEEYNGDENRRYFVDKLYKFAKRIEEAFDGQFDRWIEKPGPSGLTRRLQETLDLF